MSLREILNKNICVPFLHKRRACVFTHINFHMTFLFGFVLPFPSTVFASLIFNVFLFLQEYIHISQELSFSSFLNFVFTGDQASSSGYMTDTIYSVPVLLPFLSSKKVYVKEANGKCYLFPSHCTA